MREERSPYYGGRECNQVVFFKYFNLDEIFIIFLNIVFELSKKQLCDGCLTVLRWLADRHC